MALEIGSKKETFPKQAVEELPHQNYFPVSTYSNVNKNENIDINMTGKGRKIEMKKGLNGKFLLLS